MKRIVLILAVTLAPTVCLPAGAQAAFGIDHFDVSSTESDGTPATQAGSHPFAVTASLGANFTGDELDGRLRSLFVEHAPGLVGDTVAYPRCTRAAFDALEEGVNDCPLEAVVGISASSFDEPGKWITAPIFNLAPAPGALSALGFRVAGAENLVVDIGLSQDPPYSLIADVRDVPEALELFALKVQLWGDPASTAHDGLRGVCGVYSATLSSGDVSAFQFESKSGASCPVASSTRSFLTLPTSCEGPLVSFYGALSWEDDVDFGFGLTHDNGGNPQSLAGCGTLAFSPSLAVQPTTEAAKSPTGLDLSLAFHDEGLVSPAGRARSTVREVALVLPKGMIAGPPLTSAAGACSEADVVEEALDSGPGEGCPASARVGTVEVESPLIEASLEGHVYRAIPFENFAEAPTALYLVLKNSDLGIVVKQAVGLEPDPETGELIVFAEELPQLPFSHLRLHLDEGLGGPLITPLCGDYEIWSELVPWAADIGYMVSSKFDLDVGPGGGPCPSEESSQPPPDGPSAAPPPAVATPQPIASSCPKGKRAIRRNGVRRCVRRCRKGKRVVRRKGKIRCVMKHRKRRAKS
jgi:hypothetical protein